MSVAPNQGPFYSGWITGEKHRSRFACIGPDAILMERELSLSEPTSQVVAYTGSWCLFETQQARAQSVNESECSRMQGPGVAFISPYSLVRWYFPRGIIKLRMLYRLGPPPVQAPNVCSWFPQSQIELSKSVGSIFHRMSQENGVALPSFTPKCALSRRSKELIAKTFHLPFGLPRIAEQLGCHPAVMSRYFRKSFGVSPSRYRTLLRVMRSQELLYIKRFSVSRVATEVGFKDFSSFYRQFKSYSSLSPAQTIRTEIPASF